MIFIYQLGKCPIMGEIKIVHDLVESKIDFIDNNQYNISQRKRKEKKTNPNTRKTNKIKNYEKSINFRNFNM